MSAERLDTSLLDDALGFCSREAQHNVADALACAFHNRGYELQGNTEANDVEWFARNLFERFAQPRDVLWNRATSEDREHWRCVAQVVIDVLPDYQLRVAHRLIALSKVTRDIERALRKQPDVQPGARPHE